MIFHDPPIDVWCTFGARHERAPNFFSPVAVVDIFPSTFLLLVNGSKNSILNWVFKLNSFLACFSKRQVIKIMRIWNCKANYLLLLESIISAYKFFDMLFGHIHRVFHHCSSLDLFLYLQYLFIHFCSFNIRVDKMNKQSYYSLYSYYNFIKH